MLEAAETTTHYMVERPGKALIMAAAVGAAVTAAALMMLGRRR